MINVAILYSGNIRSFENVKEKHIKFINSLKFKYNVKVFAQTWDQIESSTNSWWTKSNDKINTNKASIEKLIVENLKPEVIHISTNILPTKYKAPHFFKSKISYDGIKGMLNSNLLVWQIFENYITKENWRPNFVIKIRYDIDFDYELFLNKLDYISKKNIVLTYFSENWAFANVYSDILIAFDFENAKKFYKSLAVFCNNNFLVKYFELYTTFIPEIFFFKFVLKDCEILTNRENLNIIRVNSDISKICSTTDMNCNYNKLIDFIKLNSNRSNIYFDRNLSNSDIILFLTNNGYILYIKLIKDNLSLFEFITILIHSFRQRNLIKLFLQIMKFKVENYDSTLNNSLFNMIICNIGIIFLYLRTKFQLILND